MERDSAELFVPSLFWVEVLNVLVRRHGWDAAAVAEGMVRLDRLEVRTVELDRSLLLLAAGEMEARGLSAYDAAYLALAMALDARLATLDDRLARAAGRRAIHLGRGPRSIAESAVTYERPEALAAWAHSAVVGAQLAKLRARAIAEHETPSSCRAPTAGSVDRPHLDGAGLRRDRRGDAPALRSERDRPARRMRLLLDTYSLAWSLGWPATLTSDARSAVELGSLRRCHDIMPKASELLGGGGRPEGAP